MLHHVLILYYIPRNPSTGRAANMETFKHLSGNVQAFVREAEMLHKILTATKTYAPIIFSSLVTADFDSVAGVKYQLAKGREALDNLLFILIGTANRSQVVRSTIYRVPTQSQQILHAEAMMPKISADPLSNKLDLLLTSKNVDLLKKTSRVSTKAASASQPYLVGLLPTGQPTGQTTNHPGAKCPQATFWCNVYFVYKRTQWSTPKMLQQMQDLQRSAHDGEGTRGQLCHVTRHRHTGRTPTVKRGILCQNLFLRSWHLGPTPSSKRGVPVQRQYLILT